MNGSSKNPTKKYDRVMPRVFNRSRCSSKSPSRVTRHEKPSNRVGAKPSVSNVSSCVFSELPMILNDYITELSPPKLVRRTPVVKPRKTITSLDAALSPNRSCNNSKKVEDIPKNYSNLKTKVSTASLQLEQVQKSSENLSRSCFSSRSHTKLRELKDEIRAYNDKEKLLGLRCNLYKKCGIVFDDVGCVAVDKAVQVENLHSDIHPEDIRSQQHDVGENAGATLSDEQMRPTRRYPVDRYMVDSSKNVEMVNILGDNLWNPEPTLRPEDEIILRKLHDMLQSTSDDLKLLSGELSKLHEPGVRIKTIPTPLDEEFNEKVHIEEVVSAKFHGYKIIDKSSFPPDVNVRNNFINDRKPLTTKPLKPKVINTAVQVNSTPPTKMKVINRNLGISRTKILHISEKENDKVTTERLNNGKIVHKGPAVSYNEFSFNYVEPTVQEKQRKQLQVQVMPGINIRSELTEQKVLNINILPNSQNKKVIDSNRSNVVVVAINHEEPIKKVPVKEKTATIVQAPSEPIKPVRKISKMSTAESSESTYISSDARLKLNTHSKLTNAIEVSPITSARLNRKKKYIKPKSQNLDEWRRKLNIVYGTTSSKNVKTNQKTKTVRKNASSKISCPPKRTTTINNVNYIPYSQLTIGGIRVSDIEKELTNIPIKNDEPLSKILDEILSSREESSRTRKAKEVPKILTTSDENLLQEVIDIERTVSDTISKNITRKYIDEPIEKKTSNEDDANDSYADDFEDINSDNTMVSKNEEHISGSQRNNDAKEGNIIEHSINSDNNNARNFHNNTTFTKTTNLSIKDSVDIFEYVHSVDTQDIATQSNASNKILPKETQTSPRSDNLNIQPIHNELWPSIDPRGEIEKMLKLEKEFIKKLIIDEYGDVLEKNIAKQSTSKESIDDSEKNVVASQKNTQTSPARVKSIMTSPRRTKTRTTSPFVQQHTVTSGQQTSPLLLLTNEDGNIENQDITINLSSPRFSLRLPQNSREVLSNLDAFSQSSSRTLISKTNAKKINLSSSSSVETGSTSELSSVGEVRLPVRKRLKKSRVPSISESTSSSVRSKYSSDVLSGGIIPLRSEGEVSLVQKTKKMSNKSEGENSFGMVQ